MLQRVVGQNDGNWSARRESGIPIDYARGRPKRLVEIEEILTEYRTVEATAEQAFLTRSRQPGVSFHLLFWSVCVVKRSSLNLRQISQNRERKQGPANFFVEFHNLYP